MTTDSVARKLSSRLSERRLYKNVYTLSRPEAEAALGLDWIDKMTNEYHSDPANRTKVEDNLASLCNLSPGDVLIYCPNPNMAKKYARMLVDWKTTIPRALEEIDDPVSKPSLTTIARSHELLWNLSVFVDPAVADKMEITSTLRDLCSSHFSPPNHPRDNRRRFQSAIRAIVNTQIGNRGTAEQAEEVIAKLMAPKRSERSLISINDIQQTINEVLSAD